jgi:hypothetical protein
MTSGPATVKERVKPGYWFVEAWRENRGVFKELVAHVIIFVLLMLILFALDYLLGRVDYPQDRKETLDKIVYYAMVTILVIFIVSLVMRLRLFELPKKENKNP